MPIVFCKFISFCQDLVGKVIIRSLEFEKELESIDIFWRLFNVLRFLFNFLLFLILVHCFVFLSINFSLFCIIICFFLIWFANSCCLLWLWWFTGLCCFFWLFRFLLFIWFFFHSPVLAQTTWFLLKISLCDHLAPKLFY